MNLLNEALRGAAAQPPLAKVRAGALVVGGGGALGSAVLSEALASGSFARVFALVREPLASALRGLVPLRQEELQAWESPAELAFVVFERERFSHGRDEAFVRPQPPDLLPLAGALKRAGVRRLMIVMPHAPAMLPGALKAGFASADEAAVAALGFEHLLILRPSQNLAGEGGGSLLQRFVDWWLSQLRWMVPQQEQPVRAVRMAALVVQLARHLPASAPGTRVVPAELLWHAAQSKDSETLIKAWLGCAPG